jgi:secretion/DNA translocation related TadE-like protein
MSTGVRRGRARAGVESAVRPAGGRAVSAREAPRLVRERGSASILVMGVGLVVVLFGAACSWVGAAVVARHQAETAADLGALAGAQRSVLGDRAACARAGRIVAANGAGVLACSVDGLDITVRVGVGPPGLAGRFSLATATARAGPLRAVAAGETPAGYRI